MKVLLAPLFFRSRYCKHCARIFYRENPGSWLGIHEFESLPPLGTFDAKRGFLPDFPTLLMFEEFVIDGEAAERIKTPGDRLWLGEWPKLLEALESEGALSAVDVAAAASARSHERGWMLRRDLADPKRWWQAMAHYVSLVGLADQMLGEDPLNAQDFSWELDPEASFGIPGSDGEVHDPAVVLQEGPNSVDPPHRELYSSSLESLKSQLREVNACMTACAELDVAPFMWAPYQRYLSEKLSAPTGQDAQSIGTAAREFFQVAFPAYAPTTVREFATLRSDKRIKALRREVRRAAACGETLDRSYPQRALNEVLRLERKTARMRRITGWIATAVGTIIPFPGVGLAPAVVAEAATTLLERKAREPWHWFYLVSDGRGAT